MNSDSKSKEIRMGSKALHEDIMQRLELLGIKRNEKFKTMYDALDGVITLAEFYKLAYKNALNEIAESHSSEEEEIDGTMCFIVSCGCEFCEQWRILNEQ
jgi:hypothetical protein